MKLDHNLQSDITNLHTLPLKPNSNIIVPEDIWYAQAQEFSEIRGRNFQARRFRSIVWLDRSRLITLISEDALRDIFQTAGFMEYNDEYTGVLVAKQAVRGFAADQLNINQQALIADVKNRLSDLSLPNHTQGLEGLIMASDIRILQMNEQVPRESLDSCLPYLIEQINEKHNRYALPYLTNCCVIIRILWPEYYQALDLAQLGLDKPLEILEQAKDAGDYIDLAAKLRFMHAAEIVYTPTGVEIIDRMEETQDIGEVLPVQKIF